MSRSTRNIANPILYGLGRIVAIRRTTDFVPRPGFSLLELSTRSDGKALSSDFRKVERDARMAAKKVTREVFVKRKGRLVQARRAKAEILSGASSR